MRATWRNYNLLIVQSASWDLRDVSSHIKRPAGRSNCIKINTLVRRSSSYTIPTRPLRSPRSQLQIYWKYSHFATSQVTITAYTYMMIAYIYTFTAQTNIYNRHTTHPTPTSPRRWNIWVRGGSNSIVLQYYCKVLQNFGIATSQNNSISIAKSQNIAILIAKFSSIVKSIAKSIAKIFKYCKKYCKIFQVLQKVLQKKSSIVKSIAK